MKKKCELIREFAQECDKSGKKYLCILTKGFKAKGYLYTEKEIEGLITLTDARIKPYMKGGECENNSEQKHLEWLNIFADDIVAFSFTE
ncbi:MAG: hypothetical protein K6A44_02445 [bacterium]|nr:hypothetical protein [bacterium]